MFEFVFSDIHFVMVIGVKFKTIAILFIFAISSNVAEVFGLKRIVGGNKAQEGEYEFIAAIVDSQQYTCKKQL